MMDEKDWFNVGAVKVETEWTRKWDIRMVDSE
jgi:hypothetical protein